MGTVVTPTTKGPTALPEPPPQEPAMGHAVMTHTQNQPGEVHLDTLPHTIQDAFDALMDQADQAADHRDLTAYALLHDQAIRLIGIRPPASGELARCTCQNCYCTAVFDANK